MNFTVVCGNRMCKSQIVVDTETLDLNNPRVCCQVCRQYSLLDKEFLGRVLLEDQNRKLEKQRVNVGFLVVHDENAPSQTFTIKAGKNVIGRKDEDKPCDIMIETGDTCMSRNHCVIEGKMERSGDFRLILSDPGSMNGTYLNSNSRRLGKNDKVYLEDGDTIQMGKTTAVVKLLRSSRDAEEARKMVRGMALPKTVVISR